MDNGSYPATGNLSSAGISNSNGTYYQYTGSGSSYCLTASVSGTSYNVSTTNQAPQAGACSGQVDGGVVTNLALDPNTIGNSSDWNAWPGNSGGSTSISFISASWATRGRAVRATWTATNSDYNGDLGWYRTGTGAGTLQPNTQYTASWKIRTSKAQRIGPTAGVWRQGDGNTGSGTVDASSGNVVTTANVEVQQWVTFTTGANTTGAKIFTSLRSGSGASYWNSGDHMTLSDLMITEGATIHKYADGDSANWVWNGAANYATSTGPPPL